LHHVGGRYYVREVAPFRLSVFGYIDGLGLKVSYELQLLYSKAHLLPVRLLRLAVNY
jgi:hypothetical protein